MQLHHSRTQPSLVRENSRFPGWENIRIWHNRRSPETTSGLLVCYSKPTGLFHQESELTFLEGDGS